MDLVEIVKRQAAIIAAGTAAEELTEAAACQGCLQAGVDDDVLDVLGTASLDIQIATRNMREAVREIDRCRRKAGCETGNGSNESEMLLAAYHLVADLKGDDVVDDSVCDTLVDVLRKLRDELREDVDMPTLPSYYD